ncbi:MAG TPA: HEAT repeat domain-containing protein [Verrucomicrobiae bacterium]|nr:HEAT repeat domain-containing protein [Verrucomicrobiae bacterium]
MTPRFLSNLMKWRSVALVLTLAVLGALVLFLVVPGTMREPEYQGKPLSFWLKQEVVLANNPMRPRLTPGAEEAVRQIGTNAVPVLLAKVRYVDNPLRQAARNNASKLDSRLVRLAAFPFGYEPRQAMLGFKALGPLAKSAIPQLTEMLNTPNESWALRALLYIGNDSMEQWKKSIAQITDENRQVNLVFHLSLLAQEIGPDAPDVSGILVQRLKEDSSWTVRLEAVKALEKLAFPADFALGPLVKALEDQQSLVRAHAAEAIGKLGKDARSALPALQKAANDKHPPVRTSAAAALQQIYGD